MEIDMMKEPDVMVYLMTGFLDSGKTQFLNFTLSQDYFQIDGKTLLILCEEGEEEYDPRELLKYGVVIETVEDKEDLTEEWLEEMNKKHKPERVVIEYNGMWQVSEFEKMKLPAGWAIEQKITTVRDEAEIIIAISADDIERSKRRGDLGITYDDDTLRLIDIWLPRFHTDRVINVLAELIFYCQDSVGKFIELFVSIFPFTIYWQRNRKTTGIYFSFFIIFSIFTKILLHFSFIVCCDMPYSLASLL